MDSSSRHKGLISKLEAALQDADSLPSDCLHDSLLNDECRQLITRALQVAQTAAADREAATAAAKLSAIPALDMPLILHVLKFLPDSYKAWAGKLVCKAAYEELKEHKRINVAYSDASQDCVLDFLCSPYNTHLQQHLTEATAKQGDLLRLQFLRQHGCAWNSSVSVAAAKAGHLAVVQWSKAQNPPCDWGPDVCTAAAGAGHLELLQWLRSQDPPCPYGPSICAAAAGGGHPAVLQWLRAQKPPCRWDRRTRTAAAEAAAHNGHLEVLKWIKSQRASCDLTVSMCRIAAAKGHLEVLQWLRSQNPPCPWGFETCSAAASAGHLEVLQWLRGQDPPCPWLLDFTAKQAAGRGHLEILQWLIVQHDDQQVDHSQDHADSLYSWVSEACVDAAAGGRLHILQWVAAHQPPLPWDKGRCLEAAQKWDRSAVVEWLQSLRRSS